MPEIAFTAAPPRADLLRQLRARLADALPGLRIVAENMLGADAPIDFVGVEPEGRAALVLVGEAGEDLELVARGLAQRDWVEARLRDWLQLAPGLGLRPEAGLRLLLLAPEFRPESRAAVRTLGETAPLLAIYRCVRNGAGVDTLVEPLDRSHAGGVAATPGGPGLRTGLSDADLDLTPEERREFD